MDQNVLREAINNYVSVTGIKKKFIAQELQESPDNFSRWLTGRRNYGKEKEQRVIDFLKNRGINYEN